MSFQETHGPSRKFWKRGIKCLMPSGSTCRCPVTPRPQKLAIPVHDPLCEPRIPISSLRASSARPLPGVPAARSSSLRQSVPITRDLRSLCTPARDPAKLCSRRPKFRTGVTPRVSPTTSALGCSLLFPAPRLPRRVWSKPTSTPGLPTEGRL